MYSSEYKQVIRIEDVTSLKSCPKVIKMTKKDSFILVETLLMQDLIILCTLQLINNFLLQQDLESHT